MRNILSKLSKNLSKMWTKIFNHRGVIRFELCTIYFSFFTHHLATYLSQKNPNKPANSEAAKIPTLA